MSGELAKGMTASSVTPSAKHYVLNEQEINDQGSTGGAGMSGGMNGGTEGPGGNLTDDESPSMRPHQDNGILFHRRIAKPTASRLVTRFSTRPISRHFIVEII